MKNNTLQQQLIELRQLEQAAQVRFNEAKSELIRIKKKIKEIEQLMKPPAN